MKILWSRCNNAARLLGCRRLPMSFIAVSSAGNCKTINFMFSALRQNVSTWDKALTVRIDYGKESVRCWSRNHISSSSPKKTSAVIWDELKKPLRALSVVQESSWPQLTNNISVIGTPSHIRNLPLLGRAASSLSHIPSSVNSSMWLKNWNLQQ